MTVIEEDIFESEKYFRSQTHISLGLRQINFYIYLSSWFCA